MPCYDRRDHESNPDDTTSHGKIEYLKGKLNQTTALLCTATQLLRQTGMLYCAECPAELQEWATAHQKADELANCLAIIRAMQALKDEQDRPFFSAKYLIQTYLKLSDTDFDKLTPTERTALGLIDTETHDPS